MTAGLGLAGLSMAVLLVTGCAKDEPPTWLTDLEPTTTTVAAATTTTAASGGADTMATSSLAGATTTTTAPQTAPVTDLAVGDCVTGAPFSGQREGQATDAQLAACIGAHDGEVVGVVTYAQGPAAAYPGRDAIAAFADDGCAAAFETYVGSAFGESKLKMLSLWPTEDSWASGDREAVCVAFKDPGPLTRSVAGRGG